MTDPVRDGVLPGHRVVEVPIRCVLTRFGLRAPRHLVPTFREYRQLLRDMPDPQSFGLLRSAFLVENPTTCYTLSLWSARPFMSANVPRHVDSARRVFGRLAFEPDRGPELWSTQWRLESVSNNLNWGELDLRTQIDEAAA